MFNLFRRVSFVSWYYCSLSLCSLSLCSLSLCSLSLCSLSLVAQAQVQAPYLNKGDGLPPFFASMEKHEVMVQIQIQETPSAAPKDAPKGLKVGFRILAQGQKVRDYKEKTDELGRAFFLGIPSNPKVQGMISY